MKVPAALGIVLVLIPCLLLMAISVPEDDLAAAASKNPLRALIAQQSNLRALLPRMAEELSRPRR